MKIFMGSLIGGFIIAFGAKLTQVFMEEKPPTYYELMSLWALWSIFYALIFTKKGK